MDTSFLESHDIDLPAPVSTAGVLASAACACQYHDPTTPVHHWLPVLRLPRFAPPPLPWLPSVEREVIQNVVLPQLWENHDEFRDLLIQFGTNEAARRGDDVGPSLTKVCRRAREPFAPSEQHAILALVGVHRGAPLVPCR